MKKILKESKRVKAGVVPFVKEGEEVRMMFMTPSDPAYGGDKPGIAKGGLEAGEDIEAGAMREAEEELGLRSSNFAGKPFLAVKGKLQGYTESYDFYVFAVQVKNTKDFGPHDYEVGKIDWLTLDEYKRVGRTSQLEFVQAVSSKIS
jgi:8-oxo-dGTP pyrophosphatase MutT (NUDIX family)